MTEAAAPVGGSVRDAGIACLCGSGDAFSRCCGPCVDGSAQARSAEALMRSRYTAYVLGDEAYLLRTWHPSTRPVHLGLSNDVTEWLGLSVLRVRHDGPTGERGEVEFEASCRHAGAVQRMREASRFIREDGRWFYLDGKVSTTLVEAARAGRNDPCPCGSGRKFKKCCGA